MDPRLRFLAVSDDATMYESLYKGALLDQVYAGTTHECNKVMVPVTAVTLTAKAMAPNGPIFPLIPLYATQRNLSNAYTGGMPLTIS